MSIDLDSLIGGPHILDACEMGTQSFKTDYDRTEDCNTISFRLNGVCYTAIEDPEDGYRSCMKDLFIDTCIMRNVFPGIHVLARKHNDGYLEFVDIWTGEVVLEIGTDSSDDYYPYFVYRFTPENMITNQGK